MSRQTERAALAEILEYAKSCRELSTDSPANHASFARIVVLAYEALGKPSLAKIDEIRLGRANETGHPNR